MRKGFTLIELLVVVAMLVILVAAITTAATKAQERARVVKATADVKEMTKAILAYENYKVNGDHRIPVLNDEPASESSLAFILGKGPSADGGQPIPVLYSGSLSSDGTIRDPWGSPYRVKVVEMTQDDTESVVASQNFQTGFFLPNFYRLKEEERP